MDRLQLVGRHDFGGAIDSCAAGRTAVAREGGSHALRAAPALPAAPWDVGVGHPFLTGVVSMRPNCVDSHRNYRYERSDITCSVAAATAPCGRFEWVGVNDSDGGDDSDGDELQRAAYSASPSDTKPSMQSVLHASAAGGSDTTHVGTFA